MGLIGSLPGLNKMGHNDAGYKPIYLPSPGADIAQISLGLRHTGASLTEIWLNGRDRGPTCSITRVDEKPYVT